MKQLLTIGILTTYLVVAIGVPLLLHFCANDLSSIRFFFIDSPSCGCSDNECSTECCTEVLHLIQFKEPQGNGVLQLLLKYTADYSHVPPLSKDHFARWNLSDYHPSARYSTTLFLFLLHCTLLV